MPPGAARNALDCALWDLDAKRSGVPAHVGAGIDRLRPVTTAYTISLDAPATMAAAARKAADRPILKIKLGAPGGRHRPHPAVRAAAPDATLIADANEGWSEADLRANLAACGEVGFALIEQPVPAAKDEILRGLERPVPLCADESVHDRESLDRLVGLYDAVNIKLDKTGGLTEALAMAEVAEARGFGLMIGCMLGTSLAMAPALLLAPRARFVDLDGPLLLARDRDPASSTKAAWFTRPPRPFGGKAGPCARQAARRHLPRRRAAPWRERPTRRRCGRSAR
jgi:L-alanine-DL-glutamate epimerase-like enolase superfamily enzyme